MINLWHLSSGSSRHFAALSTSGFVNWILWQSIQSLSTTSGSSDPSNVSALNSLGGSYVIVPRPSVGRQSGNEIGPYWQDQITSRAVRRRSRGYHQSTGACHWRSPSTLHRQLQTVAGPLQWRSSWPYCQHAGPPPQRWEMCHRIRVFNVGRQAWPTRGVYAKPES